jgi:hypothetical protein
VKVPLSVERSNKLTTVTRDFSIKRNLSVPPPHGGLLRSTRRSKRDVTSSRKSSRRSARSSGPSRRSFDPLAITASCQGWKVRAPTSESPGFVTTGGASGWRPLAATCDGLGFAGGGGSAGVGAATRDGSRFADGSRGCGVLERSARAASCDGSDLADGAIRSSVG